MTPPPATPPPPSGRTSPPVCLLACTKERKKERKRGLAFIHNHISEKNVKEKDQLQNDWFFTGSLAFDINNHISQTN
jgi:hypothetical protein